MATGTIDANMRYKYNDTSPDEAVNLKNYTSPSNPFYFPHDGYIKISSETATSGYIRLVVRGISGRLAPYMYMNVTGQYQIQSMFVKERMSAYLQGISSQADACSITYYPLTMYSK